VPSEVCVISECVRSVVHVCERAHNATIVHVTGNRHEQDVSCILETIDACVRALPTTASPVQAVHVCGQMHGVVRWTDDGERVSSLITWMDGRCAPDWLRAGLKSGVCVRHACRSATWRLRHGNTAMAGTVRTRIDTAVYNVRHSNGLLCVEDHR
jgi:hypothetical protein